MSDNSTVENLRVEEDMANFENEFDTVDKDVD